MSRRAQDLNGELTSNVEESASGISTIRSFGRRPLALGRFLDKSRELRGAQLEKVTVLAYFWVVLEIFPQVVLALVTLGGGVAVAQGSLSLGGLVAFVSLFLMLQWPIDSLGWLAAQAQEAETAAERVYEVLDTPSAVLDRPGVQRDAGRRRPAAAARASASATRARTGTCCTTSRWTSRPARRSRWSGPPAPARPR